MRKRGLIGWIILGIFGVLILIGIGAGIYFYNFYTFKEIRVCVGDAENLKLPCRTTEDCLSMFDYESQLKDAPDFAKDEIANIVNEAVYCNNTCFVRKVRGINLESGEIEMLDSCLNGEDEFVIEIRGKEGLEILNWMKLRDE